MLEILSEPWAIRALIASVLVGLMCGVLGAFIVLRNMALIGDALAHAILPGVVAAFLFVGYSTLGFFVGSVGAGLLAAAGITWIQQNVKTKNDAAIGIVFTAMFSVGVMGISWISRGQGVHLDLKDFLFGNVLGVSDQDLWLTGLVTAYVLVSSVVFYRYLFITTFQPVIAETMGISTRVIHYFLMLLLSFAVVASLQTVGVILVVAMLITPASTALLLADRLPRVILFSAILGMMSAALGLVAAIVFETTPGPAMAVVSTLMYTLAVFFAPRKGILVKWLQKRKLTRRIRQEDMLKQAFRLNDDHILTSENLSARLSFSDSIFVGVFSILKEKGWLGGSPFSPKITDLGKAEAEKLVRAHRLWETYLATKLGLTEAQIHDEAEKYEHLLTDEILDQVDGDLGFPTTDPHGSPIPKRAN